MFSKLEFFIAFKYLRSKRREKFISIVSMFSLIGIMLGVATLIIVMSVMNGFRDELVDRILGFNAHISVYSDSDKIYNYKELIRDVQEEVDGISQINALVENQVMITSNGKAIGSLVKGIEQKDLIKKNKLKIKTKNIEDFSKDNSIILGVDLARRLSVKQGDFVKIISPEINSTILGAIPRVKTYNVIGTFESGMYEYDSSIAFIPLQTAQLHFKYKNSVGTLEILVKELQDVQSIAYSLNKLFLEKEYEMNIVDWQQANSAFIGALKIERNVMFIILTLIILVAAFNIISSLIMLVNDKNKQTALLRAVGVTKGGVMRIFIICGSFIGFIGTFLGATIGILFASNIENIRQWLESISGVSLFDPTIYFLSQLPSKIIISDVVTVIILALFLSIIATIYPAYKAAKSEPAIILKGE